MTTVATIGTTDRVWCPECRKKGKDHEIKETDDLNKHYMKIHSDVPLKRATLWKKDKKKQNMMDDLNYMKFVDDFKKGGGKWDDIPDEQLKDLIETYKKDCIKTINMAASKTQADNLQTLFKMYIWTNCISCNFYCIEKITFSNSC